MNKLITTSLVFFACMLTVSAQEDITGLWEITDVHVGEQEMTPVARWTRIHSDFTFESGNGWLRNALGTYTYDRSTTEFMPYNPLGIIDKAGPFRVSFEGDKMIWEREEEGMPVRVVSERISELPMSPADLLSGLWKETSVSGSGGASPLSDLSRIYFGWDRIYRGLQNDGNRATGYWHMHAHRPELTLMPHREGATPLTWQVEVDRDTLRLTGISDEIKGVVRLFSRKQSWTD